MFRTSDDLKRMIAEWHGTASHQALRQWAVESRDRYFENLGRQLYDGKPLAEADLDYKRGVFRGMFLLLNQPTLSAKALERALNRDEVNELDG